MFRTHNRAKALLWFFRRPILPFGLHVLVLAPVLLAAQPSEMIAGYVVAFPLLLVALGLLNLPLVVSALRGFTLDAATRRNHALEHATILCLEETTGRRFQGRANRTGFRIFGNASETEIRRAFERVCRSVGAGEPLSYVTPRCGSNGLTAVAFGTSLLLGSPWPPFSFKCPSPYARVRSRWRGSGFWR